MDCSRRANSIGLVESTEDICPSITIKKGPNPRLDPCGDLLPSLEASTRSHNNEFCTRRRRDPQAVAPISKCVTTWIPVVKKLKCKLTRPYRRWRHRKKLCLRTTESGLSGDHNPSLSSGGILKRVIRDSAASKTLYRTLPKLS